MPTSQPPFRILLIAAFAVISLVLIGTVAFRLLPHQSSAPTATPPISSPPSLVTSTVQTPTSSSNVTSTPPSTSLVDEAPNEALQHHFGERVSFFLNDTHHFSDPQHPTRDIDVRVTEFTDSRCPSGVQCIWAGERGVQLVFTNATANTSTPLSLGTTRSTTGTALGALVTLHDISDAEGGTTAEITIE